MSKTSASRPPNSTTWQIRLLLGVSIGLQSMAAWGYMDPNTGGLLFQLLFPLLATAVACWVFIKNRTKRAFKSLTRLFYRKHTE